MAGTTIIPLTTKAKDLKDSQEEKQAKEEKSRNPNPKTPTMMGEEKKEDKPLKRMKDKIDLLYKDQRFKKFNGPFKNRPKNRKKTLKREFIKTGGRAGFKSGSKGCKLATKGRGRAYGKNS